MAHINAILQLIVLLTLAISAQSQYVYFPLCADRCYGLAVSGSFGCAASDIQCFCQPPASNQYLSCVEGDCNAAGVQQFAAYGRQNCGAYGFSAAVSSPAATGPASSFVVAPQTPTPIQSWTPVASDPTPFPTSSSYAGGGLSTGAKAGIGVGAGVGGAALLALLGFILFRMRRRRSAVPGPVPQHVVGPGAHGGGDEAVWTKTTTTVSEMEQPPGRKFGQQQQQQYQYPSKVSEVDQPSEVSNNAGAVELKGPPGGTGHQNFQYQHSNPPGSYHPQAHPTML